MAAFRQMTGRAGRFGLDESGEAILMLSNQSKKSKDLAINLVTAPMPPLTSSLHVGLNAFAMQSNSSNIWRMLLLLQVDRFWRWIGKAVARNGLLSKSK